MSAVSGMNGMSSVNNASVYPNYVYNTNKVSAQSLNKVNPIPNDGTKNRISYSNDLNQNDLRPGQTRNYNAVVESQQSESDRKASRMMSNSQDMQANAPKDPAQDPNKGITEITTQRNKEAAPNADIMKVTTPAEKAEKALTEPEKPDIQKSASEKIAEIKTPTEKKVNEQNQEMNISQMATAMNQQAAPNANIMDQSQGNGVSSDGSNNQSSIPNVSLS